MVGKGRRRTLNHDVCVCCQQHPWSFLLFGVLISSTHHASKEGLKMQGDGKKEDVAQKKEPSKAALVCTVEIERQFGGRSSRLGVIQPCSIDCLPPSRPSTMGNKKSLGPFGVGQTTITFPFLSPE